MNVRGSALAPDTLAGPERTGCFLNEHALLPWVQFDQCPNRHLDSLAWQNPSSDSKIRVIHVRRLDSSRKPQRHRPEFVCGHGLVRYLVPTTDEVRIMEDPSGIQAELGQFALSRNVFAKP
jgi:hypothetical protein